MTNVDGSPSGVSNDVVVGVDLGGTKVGAALVDVDGGRWEVSVAPSAARSGPQMVLDAVAALVRQVADREPERRVRAIGIGTAGVVDARRGRILSSTDAFTDWVGTDVVRELENRLEVPVVVRNDVDAHAAGEAWLGAAKGASSVLMVAVGTGVGGGVMLQGQVLAGAHHVGGEMGHMPAPGAEGLRCPCGRTGHLEAVASGPGLCRLFLARGGDPSVKDPHEVVAMADGGDHLAREAVQHSAATLGRSIAGIVTVLDPEVVVIGGGMANAGQLWWSAMTQAFAAEVIEPLKGVELRRAALGGAAPIIGAARMAWQMLDGSSGARTSMTSV